jgi:protein-disulfide isomerase
MAIRNRGISPWLIATVLLFGASPWALAQKGTKISVADDPSLKEGAPGLVLIELSDFQCPYCGEAARDVMPKVYEKLVRPGKVELIFLDLPLQMHPHAFKAAEAAACAGDQKQYWEMNSTLFGNQRALAPEKLPGYAEELGLDAAAFQKCLADGTHAGEIREDMRVAEILGIHGTPAYVVGRRLPGGDKVEVLEVIKGGAPYEYLEEKINSLLVAK